jgi:hydrogenase nickel incorporation protein HypA/HybF
MHELSVMESILNVVLKHARRHEARKVLGISLRVGEMTDLVDEWMQRYFDYLSRETIAEGAVLKIERSPVIFRCGSCDSEFPVHVREMKDVLCPICQGTETRFKSGREFFIKQIEVI